MLRSLNFPLMEEEDEEAIDLHLQTPPHHHHPRPPRFLTTSTRHLLITCADLISHSDFSSAHRLITLLSSTSSPFGDSTERLVHHFIKALSLRLTSLSSSYPPPLLITNNNNNNNNNTITTSSTTNNNNDQKEEEEEESIRSCYLSLNQITPFIRFSHLTANQAILEAIQVGQQSVHIIDLDIMHGVQWPPLMQALAALRLPPTLRITATGPDLSLLHRTGDRLLKFAQSLGLTFHFHPLLLLNNDNHPTSLAIYLPSAVTILPDEALAINCVHYLHRLLKDDPRDLLLFLHKVKALNPRVVTLAEREANHNQARFMERFVEAVDSYTAVFESLEATLPPNSRERMAVEELWFGREIMDVVGPNEGDRRRERHQRLEEWEMIMRSSGFSNVPLSTFALSQAKLLLRLHYPSEGYQLQILNNSSALLAWQTRPLFSVSSWR